jgi:hypothetical protein
MTLNIQSISAKFLEFSELINLFSNFNCSPDVICLQELWQFPSYANFTLPGYYPLEFKLRNSHTQGGGVGIFIKSHLKFTVLQAQSIFIDRIFESLFVQIELPNSRKIVVGSIYKPGTAHPTLSSHETYDNFTEILSNILDDLTTLNFPIYLFGDTNLDVLLYETSSHISDYINLLSTYGLLQVITKPTRCTNHSATIIDYVITNAFPIIFFVPTSKPRTVTKSIFARDFSEQNINKFITALNSMRWQAVLSEEDPQIAYNLFSDTFFNLYDLQFPKKEIKFNRSFHSIEPWMTKGLLTSRREKLRLASLASKRPTEFASQTYKTYRNLFNKTLRNAKKMYYERELAKNVSNLKKTWELIKSAANLNCANRCTLSKLTVDNVSYTDSYQIACKLNEFFTTMPLQIADEIPPVNTNPVFSPSEQNDDIPLLSFSRCPVTESEVLDAINMLKPKKSEDFNGVYVLF